MPKIINHDERRKEIVQTVWRLIAEEGIEAATTRRIAEATGYSNGVLLYYFPNKEAAVSAAFKYIFDDTNIRRAAKTPDPRGFDGIRTLAYEVMPINANQLAEARLILTFWEKALYSEEKAEMYSAMMDEWRRELILRLEEAVEDGEADPEIDKEASVDELLSMLMGLQVMGLFSPQHYSRERQLRQLDDYLRRLSRG
jgi:AcrR family transcriptional regulator